MPDPGSQGDPPPIFGRSVNPIPIWGGYIIPTYYYCPPIFSHLPTSLRYVTLKNLVQNIIISNYKVCVKYPFPDLANYFEFTVGFPTGQDSATFWDKGTEVPSLSRGKGTTGQAKNIAKGWDGPEQPNFRMGRDSQNLGRDAGQNGTEQKRTF